MLKQKFGPLLEALGKPSVVVPFIFPKKAAEAQDAFTQSDNVIGSGPFMFKKDEWKPGEKVVFVKNPKYKPRPEPMSGLAGGKVVKLDRVEWVWIPDAETQLNALVNGEIDMLESVNYDHLPILEKTKGVKVLTSRTSNQYTFRMNWLQPPFNDVRVRRAAAYALSQPEFLEANIGDKRYYRTCKALFTCGTPLESTVGMDGLIEGNVAKAKELLAEAKYDGALVVIPQPTDLGVIKQLAPVAKAQLEKAGFKVEVQPMDWQSMVSRLISNKGPVSRGRLERLRHQLGAGRHPRSADDAQSRRDLREGARRLAVRHRAREAARRLHRRQHAGREEDRGRRGAEARDGDRHPHPARRMDRRLGGAQQRRDRGQAGGCHGVLGNQQEMTAKRSSRTK